MAGPCLNKPTIFLQNFIYIIIIIGVIVGFAGNYIQSTTLDSTNGNSTSFIGNSLSVIGLVILIPFIISFTRCNANKNKSLFYDFIVHPGPAIVTIIILSYNILINVNYKDLLVKHNVAPEYYRYSLLFSILLIIQLIFLGKYLFEYITPQAEPSDITQYIIYLLATLNLFLLSMMQIVLNFFSTDG